MKHKILFYSKDFRYALWSLKNRAIKVALNESYTWLKRVTINGDQYNSWVHRWSIYSVNSMWTSHMRMPEPSLLWRLTEAIPARSSEFWRNLDGLEEFVREKYCSRWKNKRIKPGLREAFSSLSIVESKRATSTSTYAFVWAHHITYCYRQQIFYVVGGWLH